MFTKKKEKTNTVFLKQNKICLTYSYDNIKFYNNLKISSEDRCCPLMAKP